MNFKGFLLSLLKFVFDLSEIFIILMYWKRLRGNFYDCTYKVRAGDSLPLIKFY